MYKKFLEFIVLKKKKKKNSDPLGWAIAPIAPPLDPHLEWGKSCLYIFIARCDLSPHLGHAYLCPKLVLFCTVRIALATLVR